MTKDQKEEANRKKFQMWVKAYMRCEVCGKQIAYYESQLAHRIPKGYARKLGPEIVHHPFNMRITCDKCNCKVLVNPAAQPVEAKNLIKRIKDDLGVK